MKTKAKTQAAINVDLFSALPVGAFFQVLAKPSRRMIARYAKIDSESVQDIGDGRAWKLAETQASGAGVVLYVEPWSLAAGRKG
jgi:hypothetical protein